MSHHVPTKRSRANQESVPWTVAREVFIWNVLAHPDDHDFTPQLEPGDLALNEAGNVYMYTGLAWVQFDSSQHVAVTLGVGNSVELSLSGQELILADVLTPTEHFNAGRPHHDDVTLGVGSDSALSLSGQELTLADVLTPTEHTAIGDSSPHHAKYTDAEARTAVPFVLYIPLGTDVDGAPVTP